MSPEQSLLLHAGNKTVPRQLFVRAPGGSNRVTEFLHDTSVFELRANLPVAEYLENHNGLRIYNLPASLVFSGSNLFTGNTIEARTVLAMIADPSDVLQISIEGYRVSVELIELVRSGSWDPDSQNTDRKHKDALAARGYFQAFEAVKVSVKKVLDGENSGTVSGTDHTNWYREFFAPGTTAGIIKAADLAGYQSNPVYIRGSHHAPPSREAVRDMMPLLFKLLNEEEDPAVRVVLGHFVLVYIHPYIDGNGCMGRFLMNVMLASGGYPWVVIPVERHNEYMETLEAASVDKDIKPFAAFLGGLVKGKMNGKPGPKALSR